MNLAKALPELKRLRDSGADPYISVTKAAEIIGCKPQSLRVAADVKGDLGSLEYVRAGNELRVSIMSLIRSVCGGYPLDDVLKEVSNGSQV